MVRRLPHHHRVVAGLLRRLRLPAGRAARNDGVWRLTEPALFSDILTGVVSPEFIGNLRFSAYTLKQVTEAVTQGPCIGSYFFLLHLREGILNELSVPGEGACHLTPDGFIGLSFLQDPAKGTVGLRRGETSERRRISCDRLSD